MSKDDFAVFFDVLATLEAKAYSARSIGRRPAKSALAIGVANSLKVGNANRLRRIANLPVAIPAGTEFIKLPLPKGKAFAVVHVTIFRRKPLRIQLETILAKGGKDVFVLRFDHPHPRGEPPEHDYSHIQFAESLGPKNVAQRPNGLMAGLAGGYPAIPVPAKNAIELLMTVLLALYGHNGMLIKLNGLPAMSKSRVRQARIDITDRCTPP